MTQNWTERIDTITNLFEDHFGSVSPEKLNKKPNANEWSIAQNIEHLILINQTYFNVFEELKSRTLKLPFYGRIRFISSFFGDLILKAVEPERSKKTKTFSIWEPVESQISNDILKTFSKSQHDFKNHLNVLAKEIENESIIHTPVSRSIPLPLTSAIEIIITHEMRHFYQATATLELL